MFVEKGGYWCKNNIECASVDYDSMHTLFGGYKNWERMTAQPLEGPCQPAREAFETQFMYKLLFATEQKPLKVSLVAYDPVIKGVAMSVHTGNGKPKRVWVHYAPNNHITIRRVHGGHWCSFNGGLGNSSKLLMFAAIQQMKWGWPESTGNPPPVVDMPGSVRVDILEVATGRWLKF